MAGACFVGFQAQRSCSTFNDVARRWETCAARFPRVEFVRQMPSHAAALKFNSHY